MKKLFCAMTVLICVLWLSASVYAEQCEEKELTLMVYMCGSNLQHYNNCANVDMAEMEQSEVDPAQVNLVVLTGGSDMENWKSLSLHHLKTEWDNLLDSNVNIFQGQNAEFFGSNMGEADTLGSYVRYCVERYPAKKYALILWDHGEGPLGHICHDECNGNDGLSISELVEALKMARLPKKLSWIGFDACLMSTAEVALAVSPYAEYMIASQETEPETGWNYRCLKGIEGDENGAVTGTRFINAYLEGNRGMIGLTLSCLDLSKIQNVVNAMDAFFEPLSESLDAASFTRLSELRSASTHFGEVVRSVDNGYDLVDLESLAEQFSVFEDVSGLEAALRSAVYENGSNMDGAAGLSVYHPYYNKDAYLTSRSDQYQTIPFSEGYRQYVERFGAMLTGRAFADWSGIRLTDAGIAADEHIFTMQMSDEQWQNYASSQLIILGAIGSGSDDGAYASQFLPESGDDKQLVECYYPVWVGDVTEGADGLLSSAYINRCLYITDENGTPVAGPLGYRLSDDGRKLYLFAEYQDNSGRRDAASTIKVLYTCEADEETGEVSIVNTEVYDSVTKTYTRRLSFKESDYTDLFFDRLARCIPRINGALPSFADWISIRDSIELSLPLRWSLRFFNAQLSGRQLYATLQVTDTQQNSYCTPLIPVENPNFYNIAVSPRTVSGDGYELSLSAVMDNSPLEAGLNLRVQVTSTEQTQALPSVFSLYSIVINGTRDVTSSIVPIQFVSNDPEESSQVIYHIDATALTDIDTIETITLARTGSIVSHAIGNTTYFRDAKPESHTFCLTDCRVKDALRLPEKPAGSAQTAGEEVVWEVGDSTTGQGIWELFAPKWNAQGELEAILHVINPSDEEAVPYNKLDRTYYIVINNCIQTTDTVSVHVNPMTDSYQRILFKNRAAFSDFSVNGVDSDTHLMLDRLLQRSGKRQIESIKLVEASVERQSEVTFTLDEPIELPADEADIELGNGEFKNLLIDAGISVNLERVLVGTEDARVVLSVRNNLDRGVFVWLWNIEINGKHWEPVAEDRCSLTIGAGCTAVVSQKIEAKSMADEVSEIGFAFCYEDYLTSCARFHLNRKASLNVRGGVLVEGKDCTIDTAATGKPYFICTGSSASGEDSSVSLALDITNYKGYQSYPDKLEAEFQIDNQTGKKHHYTLENFVINDWRCVSGSCEVGEVGAGGSAIQSYAFPWAELTGLDEMSSLSCDMRIMRAESSGSEAEDLTVPLRWEFQPASLRGVVPDGTPLGQTSENGVEWGLLGVDTENSHISYRGYGDLELLFRAANHSDEDMVFRMERVVLDGLTGPALDETIQVSAHSERLFSLPFPNCCAIPANELMFPTFESSVLHRDYRLYEGCLLQSCGINELRRVSLWLKQGESPDLNCQSIELAEAWPLENISSGDIKNQCILLDDDLTLGVTELIEGENGIALAVFLRNNTDRILSVSFDALFAGELPLKTARDYTKLEVLPHTAGVESVCFIVPDRSYTGSLSGDISFTLLVGDNSYEGIGIHCDSVLALGDERITNSSHFHARKPTNSGEKSVKAYSLSELHFELGFTKRNSADGKFYGYYPGLCYLEDLHEGETFAPDLKITNLANRDVEFTVSAVFDGEGARWSRGSVAAGTTAGYAANSNHISGQPGVYECEIYLDGVNVFTATLEVRAKKTIVDLDSAKPGDLLILGSYEQDNDLTNGKEPVDWLVLEVRDGAALAVSRYALECKPYHTRRTEIAWEDCSLRKWLNEELFSELFSPAEQLRITRGPAPQWDASAANVAPGEESGDRITLLSADELEEYFPDVAGRKCYLTQYCYAHGPFRENPEDGWWWMRSQGETRDSAEGVNDAGVVDAHAVDGTGFNGQGCLGVVRPAIWIDLNAGFLTMGQYEQDGNIRNGPEPIEWLVLDAKDGNLLVISRAVLEGKSISRERAYSWEKCDLRRWLNEGFYRIVFTKEEMEQIRQAENSDRILMQAQRKLTPTLIMTILDGLESNHSDDKGFTSTKDGVFLLSYDEAERLFPNQRSRICHPTEALSRRASYFDSWWLRSGCENILNVVTVEPDGSYGEWESKPVVDPRDITYDLGVRPAMWIAADP